MIYCILKKKCYISDKQLKNNKYWFSWQKLKVYFFQLGMTFHGMGLKQQNQNYTNVFTSLAKMLLVLPSTGYDIAVGETIFSLEIFV